MDQKLETESLRDRLIIAGTDEIALHGIADFSLRRVAAACHTSCAAPYKHFKNKEEFILEIIHYINRQWELLRDQVIRLYDGDIKKQLTEVGIAYIRFWVANPNYRSVLATSGKALTKGEQYAINFAAIDELITDFGEAFGISSSERERRTYAFKALLYGTTTMLENGEIENSEQTFDKVRVTIGQLLEA